MENILYFTAACWIAMSSILLYKFSHILQVERYHTDGYIKWVISGGGITLYSPRKYDKVLHLASIIFALSAYFSPHEINVEITLLTLGALYWSASHFRAKKESKKSFVITSRIKRLLVVVVVLDVLYLFCMNSYGGNPFLSASVLLAYIQPFVIALGNFIEQPVELIFQSRFKKEAKEKIKDKKVIAITGSYGKTGTKEAVAHLLETAFPLLKTPGSFNTPMGLCKVINDNLEPHHELFVTEMGATRAGDIKELCNMVSPSIGVITSTGSAHLETFGSLEKVAKTKFELADALPSDGILIFNSDYKLSKKFAEGRPQKIITYGFDDGADFAPKNIKCNSQGSTFDLHAPEGEIRDIRIRLLGKLNVINTTAAFAVGSALGLSLSKLKSAISSLPQMESRLQLIPNHGSYLIINDGFNSNPPGAASAVETLSYFEGYQKILITPGIVDMGDAHDNVNFEFGKVAAKHCDRVLLVNERRTAPLKNGLLAGGFNSAAIEVFPTLAEARVFLGKVADDKSVVLFENDLPDHMEEF